MQWGSPGYLAGITYRPPVASRRRSRSRPWPLAAGSTALSYCRRCGGQTGNADHLTLRQGPGCWVIVVWLETAHGGSLRWSRSCRRDCLLHPSSMSSRACSMVADALRIAMFVIAHYRWFQSASAGQSAFDTVRLSPVPYARDGGQAAGPGLKIRRSRGQGPLRCRSYRLSSIADA